MRGIIRMAKQFFDEEHWHYEAIEDSDTLLLSYEGEHGAWQCVAEAREEAEQLIFYSVIEPRTPRDRRAAMAEFLTRANYNLVIGNFEMDYSDGEVRYKTSIDVEGDRLTPQLVRMLVALNVSTVDRYLPGVLRIMTSDAEPAEVIADIEQQD